VSTERQSESESIRLSLAKGRLLAQLVDIVVEADSIVWKRLGPEERRTLLDLGAELRGEA
jgi:hypothetical protein